MSFRYIAPRPPITAKSTPKRVKQRLNSNVTQSHHSIPCPSRTLPILPHIDVFPEEQNSTDSVFTASGRLMSVNKLHSTFSQMARYYEQKIKTLKKEKQKWKKLSQRKPQFRKLTTEHDLNSMHLAPVRNATCCTLSLQRKESQNKLDELRYLIHAQKQEIAFNMKLITDFKEDIVNVIGMETHDHFRRLQAKYQYKELMQREAIKAESASNQEMKRENEMLRTQLVEQQMIRMAEAQRIVQSEESSEKGNGWRKEEEEGILNESSSMLSDSNMDADDSKESSKDRNCVKMKRKKKRVRPKKRKTSTRSQSFCLTSHRFCDKRRRTRVLW